MALEARLKRLEQKLSPPISSEEAIFAAALKLRGLLQTPASMERLEAELHGCRVFSGTGDCLFASAASLRAIIASREEASAVAPPPPVSEPKGETKLPKQTYGGSTTTYHNIEKETEQQLLDRLMRWAG